MAQERKQEKKVPLKSSISCNSHASSLLDPASDDDEWVDVASSDDEAEDEEDDDSESYEQRDGEDDDEEQNAKKAISSEKQRSNIADAEIVSQTRVRRILFFCIFLLAYVFRF